MNVRFGNAVLTAGRPTAGEADAAGATDGGRRASDAEGTDDAEETETDEGEEAETDEGAGAEGKHPLKPKAKAAVVEKAVVERRQRMVVAPGGLAHVHDTSQITGREHDRDG